MPQPPVTVQRSGAGLAGLAAEIKRIARSDVLVGIPAKTTMRKGSSPINNASLLWVFSKGSPLRNIPPRPVLEPAIAANTKTISPFLAQAAQDLIEHRPTAARANLHRAGVAASNAAKRWFTDPRNGWAPNAPATIERKGSAQPGIDTGQLRSSLTYIVRSSDQPASSKKEPKEEVERIPDTSALSKPETTAEGVEAAAEILII
jgi:hypothetical protein